MPQYAQCVDSCGMREAQNGQAASARSRRRVTSQATAATAPRDEQRGDDVPVDDDRSSDGEAEVVRGGEEVEQLEHGVLPRGIAPEVLGENARRDLTQLVGERHERVADRQPQRELGDALARQ